MFSMILEMWRRGTSPPNARKNFWNRSYVFKDFVGGAGRPSPPISSENIGNQHIFIDFGGGARAPVLTPPQTTMEIIPFLMIMWGGVGRAPITPHFHRKTGEIFTFQWFWGWAGAPITSHLPKKTVEIIRFSLILKVGQRLPQWFFGLGMGSCDHPPPPKNYEHHYVLNDFGIWARDPMNTFFGHCFQTPSGSGKHWDLNMFLRRIIQRIKTKEHNSMNFCFGYCSQTS